MKAIDVESLVKAISEDLPSGADLEYDPAFVALEQAARIEPEQQFGDTIVAPEEPDWETVRELSVGILERSNDLRAARYLLQALTHGGGLAGLGQGMAVVRALLEGFWDSFHPQLDPDDDFDPTARVNIIASLCDPAVTLRVLRDAPIFSTPGLGSITLRDIQIAKGQTPAPADGAEPLSLETIRAASQDAGLPALKAALADVESASSDTAAIEELLVGKVGVSHAVSLAPLSRMLAEIKSFLSEVIGVSDVGPGGSLLNEADEDAAATGPVSPNRRGAAEISGPADVIAALDKIVAYYRNNEPSSPVPLLLLRAKRLVSLGFLEILRDLAPDALAQAENVTGTQTEAKE